MTRPQPEEPWDQADAAPDVPDHATAGAASSAPIRRGDRAFAAGNTGKGKSELFLHLFSIYRGQRLLVDVTDHYDFGPEALAEKPPPLTVSDPRKIDFRHRTIRYVPKSLSRREFDDLYAAIWHRANLLVLGDEMEDIGPAGSAPLHVRKVLKQGRKRLITHLGTSQRPHGVERAAYNQAEHLFVFPLVDEDDLDALSYRLGVNPRELARLLNELPEHGYYRHRLGTPELVKMPPLPADVIAHTRRHLLNPR